MSRLNSLLGLIANYGDSGDESEDDVRGTGASNSRNRIGAVSAVQNYGNPSAAIHPAPIAHCPWSACYDEASGFTYYWNQQTNAVTWEAPPEYLLALKLAQQQLTASGSGEVSAEEWQLYQQALAEKQTAQTKIAAKPVAKINKKTDRNSVGNKDKNNKSKKRSHSDDEEKIELITSYHNSDSESNDEAESPVKPAPQTIPKAKPKTNNVYKKPKLKTQEYGPALPPSYPVPIGPELPPELSNNVAKSPEEKPLNIVKEDKSSKPNDEDSQDETTLLMKLKDKAKLLEKLGGEIPKELQKMIEEETASGCATPKTDDSLKSSVNIDDLLEEIEKKELPKVSKTKKTDDVRSNASSAKNSPLRDGTPPGEPTPLFPSVKNIDDPPMTIEAESQDKKEEVSDKKGANLYLSDNSERIENIGKKKLRISNSVLPKKEPVYTTKYSQFIEGFSNERVGLGFSNDEEGSESPKNAISYGNGLMFTKGETLNEEKKDEDLDDLTDLVEMKLKYLNQLQPCSLTPVQEMLIQMQTLAGAFRAGALRGAYWRRWAAGAAGQLRALERRAAPPGWLVAFQRSEGRYCYRRESDGLVQWEYPATTDTDMDISTTPPHPGFDAKEEVEPPVPPSPPLPPARSSPPRARTPPPPAWHDPPPPGCDDLPPLPHPPEQKQEIGDELASFYSDIAEIEKTLPATSTNPNSPEPVEREEKKERHREKDREREREKEKDKDKDGKSKKKSKVKISSSIGLKHKSVSSLVAKWQQVAEEINSD